MPRESPVFSACNNGFSLLLRLHPFSPSISSFYLDLHQSSCHLFAQSCYEVRVSRASCCPRQLLLLTDRPPTPFYTADGGLSLTSLILRRCVCFRTLAKSSTARCCICRCSSWQVVVPLPPHHPLIRCNTFDHTILLLLSIVSTITNPQPSQAQPSR